MNADLTALYEYGQPWNIIFAPAKTSSLVISLKTGISEHPPLFLNNIQIPEVTSVKVFGFTFNSLFTWQTHIDSVLKRGRQCLGQLYYCHSFFECQDISLLYKSWIRHMLEYGSILYPGAASSHVNRLESFQSQIESMCGSTFSSLIDQRHAYILGFTCRLIDGEGRGNLQTFCPTFKTTSNRLSHRLHSFDPAFHLHLVSPCNFRTLDCFGQSWQVTVVYSSVGLYSSSTFTARRLYRMEISFERHSKDYHVVIVYCFRIFY